MPQIWVDIDRDKAKKQGVPLDDIFATLQTQLGSFYVNDFNKFGRVYRVILQAETGYRQQPEDILRLYVRNDRGEMVPLRTLVSLSSTLGPEIHPPLQPLPGGAGQRRGGAGLQLRRRHHRHAAGRRRACCRRA